MRRAAAAANRGRWFAPVRLRALAFAATLVLGIAVVLNVQTPLQPNDESAATAQPAAALPDADAVRERFEASADNAARSLQGAAESAPASLAVGRERADGVPTAPGTTHGAERPGCDAGERSSAGSWWQCAQALLESGDVRAARRELELLQRSHPDFSPPE